MKYYVEMNIIDYVEVEADDEYEAIEKAKLELGPRVADDWQLLEINCKPSPISLEDFFERSEFYKKENTFAIIKCENWEYPGLTIYYKDYYDTPLGDSIEFENSEDFYFESEDDLEIAYNYMLRKLY